MPAKRTEALHAKMTPEQKGGWKAFADRHNVTASGLAQALGEVLGDWDISVDPALDLSMMVERAAELTKESRKRPHLQLRRNYDA